MLAYSPDIVIAYDGADDAAILDCYLRHHMNYPPGTRENFEELEAMIDDMHATRRREPLHRRFFLRITRGLRRMAQKRHPVASAVREERIGAGVAAYAHNRHVMHDLLAAQGGRFVGIFQPNRSLHTGIPDSRRREKRLATYRRFHELTVGPLRPDVEYLDFATLFDTANDRVPSARVEDGDDVSENTIVDDDVHLYEHGNELVARTIVERSMTGYRAKYKFL